MSNEIQSVNNIETVVLTRAQFESLRRYPENYIFFVYEERVAANEPVAHYSLYKGDTPVVFGDVDRILPAYKDIARPGNYRVAAFCLSATRPDEPDADAFPSHEDLERSTQGWLARPTDALLNDKVWWVSFRWYNGKTNLVIEDDTWTTPVQVSGWQGPKGDKGDKGDNGDKGDVGEDGYAVFYTTTSYPAQSVQISRSFIKNEGRALQVGDFIIEASSSKNLYRITQLAADNVSCNYLGTLKGVKGDTGAAGTNGLNFYIIDKEVSEDTLTYQYASDYFPESQRDKLKVGESFLTKDLNLYEITQVPVEIGGGSTQYLFSATKKGNIKGERGEKGEKGDTGDPFMIRKTYPSVAAMNADFDNADVPLYGMVLIDTGNVEDTDNAKLYMKGEESFTFLVDLSGAQGIKGETGYSFRKSAVSSILESGEVVFTSITPSNGLQVGDIIVGFNENYYGQLFRLTNVANLTGTDLGVSLRGAQGERGERGETGLQGVQGEPGFGIYRTRALMMATDADYSLQMSEVETHERVLQVGDFIIEGSKFSNLWRIKEIPEGGTTVQCEFICSLRGMEGLSIWHSSAETDTNTTSIELSSITIPEGDGRAVKVGDMIIANQEKSYLYSVTAVSATTATVAYITTLQGAQGEKGDVTEVVDMESITWANLVAKRNAGELKPGTWYRITDYKTTVANDPGARSENHLFDVVVFALGVDKLSEEARAVHSVRDTDGYFAKAKVEAWKIWYCLDNDTSRFAWADETNGKGVIYRMIDEWQNDVGYDFKNVQFKRYLAEGNFIDDVYDERNGNDFIGMDYVLGEGMNFSEIQRVESDYAWFYTFSRVYLAGDNDIDSIVDESVNEKEQESENGDLYGENLCCSNIIKSYITNQIIDGNTYSTLVLNNIVVSTDDEQITAVYGNEFGQNCYNISIANKGCNNKFGVNCWNNIGYKLIDNTFVGHAQNNKLGYYVINNTIGSYMYNNTIGSGFSSNNTGSYFQYNSIGSDFRYNSIGSHFQYNSIGSYMYNNTIGSDFQYNSIGSNVQYNKFYDNIQYNTLLNNITYISLSQNTKNVEVLSGTKGTYDNKLDIPFVTNVSYCQFAGKNSSGELKVWAPADLV